MLSIKTTLISCMSYPCNVLRSLFTNCCCKNTTEQLITTIKYKPTPIPAHNGCYMLPKFKENQGFASIDKLGELSNHSDGKYTLNVLARGYYNHKENKTIIPNGKYDFIISKKDHEVYCYVRTKEHQHSGSLYNNGHYAVSFMFNSEIIYAGDIDFDRGELIQWRNASGHYKPREDAHLIVFNDYLKSLFPNDKFQPIEW